ncbi:Uncharacterized protein OS=Chloroflexus aggregans (strain MD-66 / DSM 9485) GN=Cagg_0685 PE=4 SV=1 [Gemmata massiliana]|uniref:Transposase zinc-ribbon domain-containing protein n=1 Tax=Gemmata massiliana TaxID=1210884 RepID=A0A6P2D6X9_9BACT|nr:hypothetical protein [Gemmata massiliana]VTR96677.1 Uncharacterized protein OS=Chloroflexus aggregans (strain MD-66 / DSM 9485) GN=Cagg_0685 PE=4 SV=1 [Gemmata massiliana]
MAFPILDLMGAAGCYQFLVELLPPEGLRCPTCGRGAARTAHARHRPPVLDYRCRHCGAVFNAYTGTPLQKTHRTRTQRVLILRGIWPGTPIRAPGPRVELRPQAPVGPAPQAPGTGPSCRRPHRPGAGARTEAGEMYQNAGEKGLHTSPRMTRPGAGRTRGAGTGRTRMTGPPVA